MKNKIPDLEEFVSIMHEFKTEEFTTKELEKNFGYLNPPKPWNEMRGGISTKISKIFINSEFSVEEKVKVVAHEMFHVMFNKWGLCLANQLDDFLVEKARILYEQIEPRVYEVIKDYMEWR